MYYDATRRFPLEYVQLMTFVSRGLTDDHRPLTLRQLCIHSDLEVAISALGIEISGKDTN